eukprot:tig00021590_g22768.t1
MFKKSFTVTSQSLISGKDAKKLKASLREKLPGVTEDAVNEILPGKADINAEKLSNKAIVYAHAGQAPVCIDADGRGDLYPTVYALWQRPDMLPPIFIWYPVSEYILNGADLMLPGVVQDGHLLAEPFKKGQKRAVFVRGNRHPIAVGEMLVDSAGVEKNGYRGKGMRVVHFYRDGVWAMGPRTVPNEGFLEARVVPEAGPSEEDDAAHAAAMGAGGEHGEEGSGGSGGEEEGAEGGDGEAAGKGEAGPRRKRRAPRRPPPRRCLVVVGGAGRASRGGGAEEMDALMETSLLFALKFRISEDELPMNESTLYSKHVLACRPAGTTIDVKKSSYKKLGKFLDAMEKRKLLKTKDQRGTTNVVSVNKQHPDVAAYVPRHKPADEAEAHAHAHAGGGGGGSGEGSGAGAGASRGAPVITEMYGQTTLTKAVFAATPTGSAQQHFTAKEARQVMMEYLEKENLRKAEDRGRVVLDGPLCDALFKGDKIAVADIPTHMRMEDLMERFLHRLQPMYAIAFEGSGERPTLKKGTVKPVQIVTEQRGGRKYVTHVSGLETFGLDPEELSKEFQHHFACSSSTAELPGKFNANREVLVQGHVLKEVGEYLHAKYRIPRKFIEVQDKTKK